MNTKILIKLREELKKEKPSIEYLLGMLETLIEMDAKEPQVIKEVPRATLESVVRTESVADEEAILNAYNNGRTGKISG